MLNQELRRRIDVTQITFWPGRDVVDQRRSNRRLEGVQWRRGAGSAAKRTSVRTEAL